MRTIFYAKWPLSLSLKLHPKSFTFLLTYRKVRDIPNIKDSRGSFSTIPAESLREDPVCTPTSCPVIPKSKPRSSKEDLLWTVMSSWLDGRASTNVELWLITIADRWRRLDVTLWSLGSTVWYAAWHFSHTAELADLIPLPLVVMVTSLLPTNQVWLCPPARRNSARWDLW